MRLPGRDRMPRLCPCGAHVGPSDANNHFLGCTQLRASGLTFRHDMVKHALASTLRAAGASVQVERLTGDGMRRFDLVVLGAGRMWAVDVTVVHPSTAARMRAGAGADDVGDCVAAAERAKIAGPNGYRDEALRIGAEFVPFAMDVFGHMGEHARRFLNCVPSIAEFAPYESGLTTLQLRQLAKEGVSVAAQRGNAMLFVEGYARALYANLGRRDRAPPV